MECSHSPKPRRKRTSINPGSKRTTKVLSGNYAMEQNPQRRALIELAWYRMPFGKYKGQYLLSLPLEYLLWFRQKGFPQGRLGQQMKQMLEIKENGLEGLLHQIRKEFPGEST